jgi:hypothetical protein
MSLTFAAYPTSVKNPVGSIYRKIYDVISPDGFTVGVGTTRLPAWGQVFPLGSLGDGYESLEKFAARFRWIRLEFRRR